MFQPFISKSKSELGEAYNQLHPPNILQERTTELSSERIVEGCVGRLWQQCAPETQHSKECKVYRHCKRITLNTVNDRLA